MSFATALQELSTPRSGGVTSARGVVLRYRDLCGDCEAEAACAERLQRRRARINTSTPIINVSRSSAAAAAGDVCHRPVRAAWASVPDAWRRVRSVRRRLLVAQLPSAVTSHTHIRALAGAALLLRGPDTTNIRRTCLAPVLAAVAAGTAVVVPTPQDAVALRAALALNASCDGLVVALPGASAAGGLSRFDPRLGPLLRALPDAAAQCAPLLTSSVAERVVRIVLPDYDGTARLLVVAAAEEGLLLADGLRDGGLNVTLLLTPDAPWHCAPYYAWNDTTWALGAAAARHLRAEPHDAVVLVAMVGVRLPLALRTLVGTFPPHRRLTIPVGAVDSDATFAPDVVPCGVVALP